MHSDTFDSGSAGGKKNKWWRKIHQIFSWNTTSFMKHIWCMYVCMTCSQCWPTLDWTVKSLYLMRYLQIQFICIFFILFQRCNLSRHSLWGTWHLRGKSHQWWNWGKYGWSTDGQKKIKIYIYIIIKNNWSEPWRTRSAFPASDWLPSLLGLQKSIKIITTWNVTGRSFDQWPCQGPASYEPSPRRPRGWTELR